MLITHEIPRQISKAIEFLTVQKLSFYCPRNNAHCFQNGSERTNHKNGLKYIFLYLTTAPKQYLIPEFLKPGHKVCLIIHFV